MSSSSVNKLPIPNLTKYIVLLIILLQIFIRKLPPHIPANMVSFILWLLLSLILHQLLWCSSKYFVYNFVYLQTDTSSPIIPTVIWNVFRFLFLPASSDRKFNWFAAVPAITTRLNYTASYRKFYNNTLVVETAVHAFPVRKCGTAFNRSTHQWMFNRLNSINSIACCHLLKSVTLTVSEVDMNTFQICVIYEYNFKILETCYLSCHVW